MKKRALLSVSDKQGIETFARELVTLGYELLSTGGTMSALEKAGIPVISVSDVTGFPECLDGRVKTLHPAIHGGLLAMRDNPEHMARIAELGIEPIDMLVINLYPFRATISKPDATFEEAIENIDIGGPAMLRAAAKNWQDVTVLVNPADYAGVLEEIKAAGDVSRDTKLRLCYQVFAHTAAYDALIAQYLHARAPGAPAYPDSYTMTYDKVQDLRYGENPHQTAAFYREPWPTRGCLPEAKQLNGKELSYCNINDADGALALLREFETTAVVAVKHANPCGVGLGDSAYEAYMKAYAADPMSIYGGIVAFNAEVDVKTAEELAKIFLEIIIAPSYSPAALKVLLKKKNLRVLELDTTHRALPGNAQDMRKVAGGLLVQQADDALLPEGELTVMTERAPTDEEMRNLLLAWRIVKHTKSNGIAIAANGQSLGIGPGQVNRIWAAQSAIERSGERVKGAALASDALFPFDDCVRAAAAAGITAIIQPGGGIRDQDSIDACNEFGIAMVATGMRHFKH